MNSLQSNFLTNFCIKNYFRNVVTRLTAFKSLCHKAGCLQSRCNKEVRCAGVTALLTTNRQPLYQCRVTRSHTGSASVEREYQHCYQQQQSVSQCDETHRWIQFHSDRPVSTHWCGTEEPVLNHNTRHDHTNFRSREHRSNLMFSRFSFSSIKIKKFENNHLPYQ